MPVLALIKAAGTGVFAPLVIKQQAVLSGSVHLPAQRQGSLSALSIVLGAIATAIASSVWSVQMSAHTPAQHSKLASTTALVRCHVTLC
jgi:hypothetical protein